MPENNSHWSKDFVEHLRTVHFSLVVVASALLITGTNPETRKATTAFTQVQQIAKLTGQWPVVVHAVYNRAMVDSKLDARWFFPIAIRVPRKVYALRELDTDVLVPEEIVSGSEDWRFRVPVPTAIDNLAQFRDFWNALDKGIALRLPVKPEHDADCDQYVRIAHADASSDVISKESEETDSDFDFLPPGSDAESASGPQKNSKQTDSPDCEIDSKVAAYSAVSGPMFKTFYSIDAPEAWEDDNAGLRIEMALPPERTTRQIRSGASSIVSGSVVKFRFQRATINEAYLTKLYFSDWRTGPFDKAFPELNSIMTGISTLPITDALHRVESQVASAQQNVSVLGFTIPLAQLSRWGALVLIGVQIYLWLHLYELTTRIANDSPGLEVAWIGIYRSLPSRLAMIVSCAILPVSASAVLAVHIADPILLKVIISVAVIALSAALSLLVLERVSELRKKMDASSSQ